MSSLLSLALPILDVSLTTDSKARIEIDLLFKYQLIYVYNVEYTHKTCSKNYTYEGCSKNKVTLWFSQKILID